MKGEGECVYVHTHTPIAPVRLLSYRYRSEYKCLQDSTGEIFHTFLINGGHLTFPEFPTVTHVRVCKGMRE